MRIDHYLLGYRSFSIKENDRASVANALLRRGLSAKISYDGEIIVSLIRVRKYKNALSNIEYTVSDIKGLPAVFLNFRHRYGIIVGFLIAIIYILYASSFVWDIRIEGNESVSAVAVEEELEKNGFFVGGLWKNKGLSEIEADVLESSENIGWININRRGCVGYVTVREKNVYDDEEDKLLYSNIVATADCVIKEITVREGIACVKAGDTVKAGELLISGVIPTELGGGFVRADGDVFGILEEKIELTVEKNEPVYEYAEARVQEVKLKIFNFSLKLFKKYRKSNNACVIINDEKEFVLFGKYRIPFSISKVYTQAKNENTRYYTEKEMVEVASARLNELRARVFRDYDVLKMKTSGKFTDGGYTLVTEAVVTKGIGEERAFSSLD